jgi:hypothetical protein
MLYSFGNSILSVTLQANLDLALVLLMFLDHTNFDTHPADIFWMIDKLVTEATTYTAHSQHNRRNRDPNRQPATDLILRPQGHGTFRCSYTLHVIVS